MLYPLSYEGGVRHSVVGPHSSASLAPHTAGKARDGAAPKSLVWGLPGGRRDG
jgi:hypothetical protein